MGLSGRQWLVVGLSCAALAWSMARAPLSRYFELLGALGTFAVGLGMAGLAGRMARRLDSIRPIGVYLRAVVMAEAYLFAILGALTAARASGIEGVTADWRHWRVVAVSGLPAGLLWGWLSRNDGPPEVGGGDRLTASR